MRNLVGDWEEDIVQNKEGRLGLSLVELMLEEVKEEKLKVVEMVVYSVNISEEIFGEKICSLDWGGIAEGRNNF